MKVIEQKSRGWFDSDVEKMYRVIFENNEEADSVIDALQNCADLFKDDYECFTSFFECLNRYVIKVDKFHEDKPTVAVYNRMLPDAILSLMITCYEFVNDRNLLLAMQNELMETKQKLAQVQKMLDNSNQTDAENNLS